MYIGINQEAGQRTDCENMIKEQIQLASYGVKQNEK